MRIIFKLFGAIIQVFINEEPEYKHRIRGVTKEAIEHLRKTKPMPKKKKSKKGK